MMFFGIVKCTAVSQHSHLTISPCPHLRPQDCNSVHTDTEPSPLPKTTPYPDAQPLTFSPSKELDRELQEAFQECEEQMASLGMLGLSEATMITPEVVKGSWGKTGEDLVTKTESSLLPLGEVQQAQSSEHYGNESTHVKSDPANSQKDTDVFSFRNYILGISSNVKIPEAESEIKTSPSLDKCSEIKQEKKTKLDVQKKTSNHSELKTEHLCNETQIETVAISENDCLSVERGDYNVAVKENTTQVCKKVMLLGDIEDADSKKEHTDETRSDICETVKDGDSVHATQGGSKPQVKELFALSQIHLEQQADVNMQSEFEKKPKKGKKKPRARKKKRTVMQAKEDFQPLSPLGEGIHVESVTNVQSEPQQVPPGVTCRQQSDNVFNYKQQLNPGEKPSTRPQLSPPSSGTDHLSQLACSPASRRAPLRGPPQSDDHNHTNASWPTNHCAEENAQNERNGNTDIIKSQNIPWTCVQAAVVCPSSSTDQRSVDVQTRDAVFTSGAVTPPQEDQMLPLNSPVCVGGGGVENALEEAVVVVAALPLMKPTIQELIKTKGEAESVMQDSLEAVTTVAFIESEKAVGEECLGGKNDVGREKEELLDSQPQLSLIPSQETCSLAFSATGQHTSEERCSSRMPHNVVEAETKGLENLCNTDIEVSSTERQARGKELLFLEAFISTSPYGLLTGPDCLDHSVVGLEAAEEGGEEDMKHKGGLASEHIIFSQPEGSVGGVSSAETETCPPTDVAESLLKPQYSSEQTPTITQSLCIEKDHSSQCWQEQQNAADLTLSTPSEQSSSNTNGEVRAGGKLNVISEEAPPSMDGTCEELSITQEEKTHIQVFPLPQPTSQRTSIKQESNNIQQVAPDCGTFEAGTAEDSSEFQVQVTKGKQAMSSVGLRVCDDRGRKNKMHFEDLKNMSVMATDFDSLPPLTVRESLQHPVVETSYIFQEFLNNNKPEISTSAADRKDELPTWRPPDLRQEDFQLNKGETGIKDHHINLNVDNSSLKTNTLDLNSTDETHSKLLQCSNKNQNNENYLALTQNAICETDNLKAERVPEKVVNLFGAVEKALDTLPFESELPQSLAAEGGVPVDFEKRGSGHNLSFCPHLPAVDGACKHLNNVFTETPVVQLTEHLISEAAETAAITCTDSPQPSTQLDTQPPCGLHPSDPSKASLKDNIYLQADKPPSEVTTCNQLHSSPEQSASDHAFGLQPSGPMLNHLEVIPECNNHEMEEAFKTDSGIMSVTGKESVEMAMMTAPKNDTENRNDPVASDIVINTCVITALKVENVSPDMTKTGSGSVILQSTRDDLNNISCSLSSGQPDNEFGQDGVKANSTIEDQPCDEKRRAEVSTDNRQETDSNGPEIAKAPRQTNATDNGTFGEASGHNAESLWGDMTEEGKKHKNASESHSHTEAPESSAEVQASSESAFDKSPDITETLQCSSEHDAAQSDAVLAQTQSKGLDPQQALFPGINLVAEKGDSFVGNLCLSGSQNEAMIDVAKEEGGTEAVGGVGQVCWSSLASISNDNRLEKSTVANVGIELDSFHAGHRKPKSGENILSGLSVRGATDSPPDTELLSEDGFKGQEENNLPAVCHGAPGTSTNTDMSVVPASQEGETRRLPVSGTSEVSTGTDDIYTQALQRNEADGIDRQTLSRLPEPVWQQETVGKDSTAVNSNSSETEECEIQHTVDESLKLQTSSVTSATQNDVGAPAPVQGSTEENTTSAQQSAVKEIRATKKEGMETNVVVNLQTASAEDGGMGSFKVSGFNVCGETRHSSETTVCNAEESVCAFKAIEYLSDADKGTPDVVTVSSVISSKSTTDLSSPAAELPQSEKIHDQTFVTKPEDTIAADPVVAATEDRSLHKGSSCNSPVEQKTVNTETEDVPQNLTAEVRAQDQSTVWIEALKEAAAHCLSKQHNTMVLSR